MKFRRRTVSLVVIGLTISIGLLASSFPTSTVPHSSHRRNLHAGRRRRMSSQRGGTAEWRSLDPESLVAAPCLIEQTLCQTTDEQPRMARDADYAVAVLDAWRTEERESGRTWSAEARPVTYYVTEGNENVPLAGTVVRRQGSSTETVPGILLFHTAAGPHDVFLLWKAASLVNSVDAVVLIADVLSDESGWGWDSDRSRYTEARNLLLEAGHGGRPVLQGRVQAAVDTLIAQDDVDSSKLAALGWCLGGHSILELGRMHTEGMRAMVTFHGVFGDDTGQLPNGEGVDPSSPSVEILICSGVQDPFVPSEDLEQALELFQRHGHRVSLLQLRDAKHGFTNPAQEFNENKEAFAFHKESADKAWRQTLALLKRTIASS